MMTVKLSIPTSIVLQQPVTKVIAEGIHGNFCLLPKHTDYLSPLVPGILMLTELNGEIIYFANDHGLLVKQGDVVSISVRRALRGPTLETLKQTVHDRFLQLDENDRACQTAVASLEASFLRKFFEMQSEVV